MRLWKGAAKIMDDSTGRYGSSRTYPVGKVYKLCSVKIYLGSRVHGHWIRYESLTMISWEVNKLDERQRAVRCFGFWNRWQCAE